MSSLVRYFQVLAAGRKDYPVAADGRVPMPFRRLFFVAWKQLG